MWPTLRGGNCSWIWRGQDSSSGDSAEADRRPRSHRAPEATLRAPHLPVAEGHLGPASHVQTVTVEGEQAGEEVITREGEVRG